MMSYKRGDVVLLRFPHSDLTTYSKRPGLLVDYFLVVQADDVKTGLPQKIVVLITKTPRRGSTRVPIKKGSHAGRMMNLLHDSVVVADNIRTVEEREIDKVIGHCPDMTKVDDALRK
ncbi:unnamed protein product, partial [marine sediment metagenome]